MPSPNRRLAIVTDPHSARHAPPGFHPERPERLGAALRGAERALDAPDGVRVEVACPPATDQQLARVHSPEYIATLERVLATGDGWIDGDTYFSAGSRDAARLAAGGACAMVDALMDDRADAGIVLARPPGHHAMPDRAMGFCLFNNVAVAAAHAVARGARRVAVVDWDVHHGNGTQAAFEHDPRVVFVSLHQWPLYPGTGAATDVGLGDAAGATINLPLPARTDGSGYRAAFERVVLPALESAAPDLVLVSAGFDAHRRDPIGQMDLEADDFGWMGAAIASLAARLGNRPVGLVLEGGYDLLALEQSVEAAVRAVLRHASEAPRARSASSSDADTAIARTVAAQRPHWPAGVF